MGLNVRSVFYYVTPGHVILPFGYACQSPFFHFYDLLGLRM